MNKQISLSIYYYISCIQTAIKTAITESFQSSYIINASKCKFLWQMFWDNCSFFTASGIHAGELDNVLGMGGWCHTCQSRVPTESAYNQGRLR